MERVNYNYNGEGYGVRGYVSRVNLGYDSNPRGGLEYKAERISIPYDGSNKYKLAENK